MSLLKCTPFQKVEVSGTLDNNSVLFSAQRMSIVYFYLDLKLQTAQYLHHDSKKLKKAVYWTSENELLDVFTYNSVLDSSS